MKIYSLLLVKDEEDIIVSVLRSALEWSDKIIVMDNGSSDTTWEIVKSLSSEFPQIIPFAQDPQTFKIGLRALLFNAFKLEMTEQDWWCIRMDADEFYKENPREFLSKIPFKYKQVYKASIDFFITPEDLSQKFTGSFEEDEIKIRYYQPRTWAELRFVRHSDKLKWDINQFKPSRCGMIYPKQIPVFHYQFRSPQQMKKRYEIRQKARNEGCNSFKHETGSSWENYLKPGQSLALYDSFSNIQLAGNRNKFNKPLPRFFRMLLTVLRYY